MKKYQLADLHNGPFGDAYRSLAEAEQARIEAIAEGKEANRQSHGSDEGSDGITVESFIRIVDADTGEEV